MSETEKNTNVDPETQGADPNAAGQQTPDSQGKPKEEKTFTQAELDTIVQSRLATERKKMPSKEELAAFKKWQEEQKKDEPANPEAAAALSRVSELERELESYKNREKVIAAGVAADFAEYVTFEVSKRVTDDVGFDAALTVWLKDNERFKTSQQPDAGAASGKASQGMRQQGAPDKPDGVEEAFYRINPQLRRKD